jgi:hypothetical protein
MAATVSKPRSTESRSTQRRRDRDAKPVKTCPVCQRPFEWRRKWARCWDEVKYCSDACRRGTPR